MGAAQAGCRTGIAGPVAGCVARHSPSDTVRALDLPYQLSAQQKSLTIDEGRNGLSYRSTFC
jgi:hypothetical protein